MRAKPLKGPMTPAGCVSPYCVYKLRLYFILIIRVTIYSHNAFLTTRLCMLT